MARRESGDSDGVGVSRKRGGWGGLLLLLLLLVRALTNKGRQTIKSTAYETDCEHGGDCSPDFGGTSRSRPVIRGRCCFLCASSRTSPEARSICRLNRVNLVVADVALNAMGG